MGSKENNDYPYRSSCKNCLGITTIRKASDIKVVEINGIMVHGFFCSACGKGTVINKI